MPNAKKGSTVQETTKLTLQRKCLVKCVDFLCKNEAYAVKVWDMIQHDMIQLDVEENAESELFKDAPKTFRKIDPTWKARWLCRKSGGSLTPARLKQQDEKDEHFVHDVFNVFLKVNGTESLQPDAIDQRILEAACDIRYMDLDAAETVKAWAERCVAEDTPVDWMVAGAYGLVFRDNKLDTVMHRSSGLVAEVPDNLVIDKDSFRMENPTSDRLACLFRGKVQRYMCCDFFVDMESGPHVKVLDKKGVLLKSIFATAVDRVRLQRSAAAEHISNESVELKDHTQAKREKALEAARTKATEQPAKRARTVALSTIPALANTPANAAAGC
jgi:hypothetical protein